MSSQSVIDSWKNFVNQWMELAEQTHFPEFEPDEDWPSPCQFKKGDQWQWQPVAITDELSFENVEQALDIQLNKDFTTFYTQFYSDNLDATHDNGVLQFLQAWSKPDFERLQQNLIGHLIMKGKLKQTPTLFFAVTDQDDLNIVINNDSGEVCLEYVGKDPHEVLANNLAEFIAQTQPLIV